MNNNYNARNSSVVPRLDLSFNVNQCDTRTKINLENKKKEDLIKIKFSELKISKEKIAKNLKRKLGDKPKNYFNIVDLLREQKNKCINVIPSVVRK